MAAATKPAVYMDTCCFIDMAKQSVGALPTDRDSDVWHCRKLLEAARDGHMVVFTSTLTIAECQHCGDGTAPQDVQDLYNRLLMSGQFVTLVQLTPFVAADARDLRWKHGIKLSGADAVHVASALDRKCAELVTTDEALISAATPVLKPFGLRIIRGRDTAVLPASYRQADLLAVQHPSPPAPQRTA